MHSDKGTNIFSEVGKFFKENDGTSAMNAIMDMTNALHLSETRLFGSESKCNCKLTQLQVFGLQLLFPCFMIRNAYNYASSSLSGLFICKSDTFFRFLSRDSYDWRRILSTVSWQLWRKTQEKRTSRQTEPVCLMVDDTDFPKRGRLGCWYITVDVTFAGRNVHLFFYKRGKRAKWNGLITTNRELDFFEAYRIYSRRWSLEVVFKESKQNLGLGKYQMRNFSSQVAMTAITAIQYNLLSTARRFSDYETVGGLFKDAVKDSVELTLTERIWDMMLEMIREIAQCFNIEDEQIFDTLVNRSDKLSIFVEKYQLKLAS